MRQLPRVMHDILDLPPRRPQRDHGPRIEHRPMPETPLTLEQAERLLRRFDGRPAAIANPFAPFPNRSLWLHRMMVASRTRR